LATVSEKDLLSVELLQKAFGGLYARRLKRKHRGYGDTFYIDEVFAGVPDHKINGKQHYLWRAVDQDGEVVDVFLQARRDGALAQRFPGTHAAVLNLFDLGRLVA
jgi:putative transposase